ncbi:MAG TPA: toxic anion resistance protein [Chloroflexota bacterium]|nr:toxic anion resistance protein [Chloroflexota bacterium]
MTGTPERPPAGEGLALDPMSSLAGITVGSVPSEVRLDAVAARRIEEAVQSFVDSIVQVDAQSPAFERKVRSIRQLGDAEIRRSAETSSRFLDRPTAALQNGPLSQSSQIFTALLALRRQLESLDPSRHLGRRRGLLNRLPIRDRIADYLRSYQSAQGHIDAIITTLYRGRDELTRDNAAIEQEKAHLWDLKGRLERYAYMTAKLDEALTARIAELEATDPEKARALREDVLFHVRQKRQDLLTQLSVHLQGYLALDLIRRNNVELIRGIERATTTTIAALRTAVIVALALGNQRLVLDQISALNATTGQLIEATSQVLRQQAGEIQGQAAGAVVSVEKLQAAFNNVYATIDAIDSFKQSALETMQQTIQGLSVEVEKARAYIERARSSEFARVQADQLDEELQLPAAAEGE